MVDNQVFFGKMNYVVVSLSDMEQMGVMKTSMYEPVRDPLAKKKQKELLLLGPHFKGA